MGGRGLGRGGWPRRGGWAGGVLGGRWAGLKGLSYEIDFENVDEN
jgi:hypothetical protein